MPGRLTPLGPSYSAWLSLYCVRGSGLGLCNINSYTPHCHSQPQACTVPSPTLHPSPQTFDLQGCAIYITTRRHHPLPATHHPRPNLPPPLAFGLPLSAPGVGAALRTAAGSATGGGARGCRGHMQRQ